MSILHRLKAICDALKIPAMVGIYVPPQGEALPPEFAVLIPLEDELTMFADDLPRAEVQQARLSLYVKDNFLKTRRSVRDALLKGGVTITDMRLVEREKDTGYYHYAIDTQTIAETEDLSWLR